MFIRLLPLLIPLVLLASALIDRRFGRERVKHRSIEVGALLSCVLAVLTVPVLKIYGQGSSALIGLYGVGFSTRLDVISVSMLLLVTFVGWIVLRYTITYLINEPRQTTFLQWMVATLGSVLVLVQAGNLVILVTAWVMMSVSLQQLLLFYSDRPQAQRAARKKFVVARLSDGMLIIAAGLLWWGYGHSDLTTIGQLARAGNVPISIGWAAGLIAIAAMLKSAQFPMHGWLTEVMEAPTPVSALLHAGVINAGGFLLIRFADVVLLNPSILAILVMVGGFTALFGGLTMLAQPAIKTSLAWSTIAQMGFMTMQCGLSLFPLALLHIVAHSLYKAHAFLSSGGAVDNVLAIRRPGPVAIPSPRSVAHAFCLALIIYAAMSMLFGFYQRSPQSIALGGILVLGTAYLLAQGLADAAPRLLTRRTVLYATLTSVSYFLLHNGAEWLSISTLPPPPIPDSLEWALLLLVVFSFGVIAVAQSMFPLWAYHPAAASLRVHLANGLYTNAIFDRLVGNWRTVSRYHHQLGKR